MHAPAPARRSARPWVWARPQPSPAPRARRIVRRGSLSCELGHFSNEVATAPFSMHMRKAPNLPSNLRSRKFSRKIPRLPVCVCYFFLFTKKAVSPGGKQIGIKHGAEAHLPDQRCRKAQRKTHVV